MGVGIALLLLAQFIYPESGSLTQVYWTPTSYGYHRALDIAANAWTPIGAARAGTISFAGWSGGYGNLQIVDHGNGYQTYYAHQIQFIHGEGAWVGQNWNIGYVGSTGNSTGPHLHFEIRRWGSQLYQPGWVGQWVSRGNAIPYTYEGLYDGDPPPQATGQWPAWPNDGYEQWGPSVTLWWDWIDGADSYEVWVEYYDGNGYQYYYNWVIGAQNNFTFWPEVKYTWYRWWVRAHNAAGWGEWSYWQPEGGYPGGGAEFFFHE